MIQTSYGEREGQAPRILDLNKPLGTVVAGGQKHALVAAFLAKHYGGVVGQSLERSLGTVTAVDHHSLIAASLVGIDHASSPSVWPVNAPLGTATTKARYAMVAAFLTHYYGTVNVSSPNDPLDTVTTLARHGLVTVQFNG